MLSQSLEGLGPAEGPVVGIPMRNGNFVQSVLLLPAITSLCPSLSLSGTTFTKAPWDPGATGEKGWVAPPLHSFLKEDLPLLQRLCTSLSSASLPTESLPLH